MRVLVAWASRHGSTRGIAERIADTLRSAGLDAELRRADEVHDAGSYDAFVIGAAAYLFHWERSATSLVRRNAGLLRSRPTWLFTSGPLGTERVDAEGRDVLAAAVPREFPELADLVRPRGQEVFFGAYDPAARPVGVMERLTRMMPAARDALPVGDFRDWDAIEGWARRIAGELAPVPAAG